MNERIKELRKALKLTQQEFADRLGVKRNTIANYEIDRNEPSASVIALICRVFQINEEWLRTGSGEMETPKPTDTMDALAKERGMSENDRILVEKFLGLKPEGREAVMQYILEVAAAVNAKNAGASPPAAQPAAVDEKKGLSVQPVTEEEKAMAELAISGLRYEKEPALQVSSAKESGAG